MRSYGQIVILFLLIATVSAAVAQEPAANDLPKSAPEEAVSRQRRPNLMLELRLSPEQVQRMREVNSERRPKTEQAHTALRLANRALDNAIYSDTVNEDEIEQRLNDVHAAQTAVAKLRAESELGVRKILTPEQLVKFRELRSRFAESGRNGRGSGVPHRTRRLLRERQIQRPN